MIIPEIEKEVNEGKNFAPLRQIYHALILAKWYKETIKNSLLSKVYVDKNKVAGVDSDDPAVKEQIYARYMQAYKKGVYDYIKEEYDAASQHVVPRKYFSGGEVFHTIPLKRDSAVLVKDLLGAGATMTVDLAVVRPQTLNKQQKEILRIKMQALKKDVAMLTDSRRENKACVFGIGAMARGYLGDILEQAKFSITYIEDNEKVVRSMNSNNGFELVSISNVGHPGFTLRKVVAEALMLSDGQSETRVAESDLVFVSSHPDDYADVGKVIAKALLKRLKARSEKGPSPLRVIVISNQIDAHQMLRKEIFDNIDPERRIQGEKVLRIISSVTDRIVPSFDTSLSIEFDVDESKDELITVVEASVGIMELSKEDWIGDDEILKKMVPVNFKWVSNVY